MRKIIFFLCLVHLFLGCNSEIKKEPDFSEFLSFDKKTKKLTIDFNKIEKYDINSVEFRTKRNLNQLLFLDSLKQIAQIENSVKVENEGYLKNTWITFDRQSNLNRELSFYYDSYILSTKDNDSSYITYDVLFNLFGGKHYAVVGDYDQNFNLKPGSKVDTFWIKNDEPLIMIPVDKNKKKAGWNNIRFIVYEDNRKGDTITRKRTFVDRDYFIEFEK
jgi:hypothetical protein